MDTKTDNRGVEYVEDAEYETLPNGWALCGHCHRAWNDDKSTSVTPTPSGRCPFEYEHVYEDDELTATRTQLGPVEVTISVSEADGCYVVQIDTDDEKTSDTIRVHLNDSRARTWA